MFQITEPGQHKRSPVIGIDLGTTNSLVAHRKKCGTIHFFADENGNALLPSAVAFAGENIIVGTEALSQDGVITSAKRLIGLGFSDVENVNFPYEITGDDSIIRVQTSAGKKTPVEISAHILKTLKNRAEDALKENVYDAVITVPAYFNDAQRQATRDAAKISGLNVLRLVSEPTAAALAYGLDKKARGLFLVYDLGGGTFDVSLLKLVDGVFRVLATGGDTALGGDDIDRAVAKELNLSLYEAKSLKEKISLGEVDECLTLEKLNEVATPFVEKTLQICESVLDDADIEADDLDGIVLVGGSTRLNFIHQRIENLFGRKAEEGIDPDKVVAHGAALQASALSGGDRDSMLLLDVTPLSVGLETMGGLVEKVIDRNTPIPITRAQEFTTFKDNQNAMDIHVLQGERETVEHCRSLAKFRLSGIPPLPAGAARVQVIFSLDADGILTVTAKEESTGVEQKVDVVPSYGLKEEEVITMLKSSISHAREDVGERLVREARLELERLLDACASALEKDGKMLSDTEKRELLQVVKGSKTYLSATNIEEIENTMQSVEEVFRPFSELRVNSALKAAVVGQNVNEV